MATKVKDTPILRGNDARRFERMLAENKSKKVSRHEFERALGVYRRIGPPKGA